MKHRFAKLLLAAVLAATMTGCGDQRVLEKLGFTQTTSYDLADKDQLEITVSIPKAEPRAKTQRELLSATAPSSKEARIKLARQTNLLLVSGQLRNAIFSMAFARKGMEKHIDTLVRDPSISPRLKISIVNGNAKVLLRKDYKEHPITGRYIDGILEKESIGRSIPVTTLYSFTRDLYDDGIDPVAPILKDAGDHINVDGIALFRGDRYITKIPAGEGLVFAFLRGSFKQGEISVNLPDDTSSGSSSIMLSSLLSRRTVTVRWDASGTPSVHFYIRMKGSVLEYTGSGSMADDADRKKIEQSVAKELTRRGQMLIDLMLKNRVDSLGMGIAVRNRMDYAAWKALNWLDNFPKVKATCSFDTLINNTGKVE
ncbi:Ger(x)C family spore germination protein [Paenibacillus silvisoli]|uniref:Ger(x)C family spore germination protein n=1 Tax=Paenibacillus silvisoli TaxID=3110539 RepID=UPI00280530DC|nr:Ger(x)C family spore germination protein [Paenibacillus silvisoli]